MDVELVARLRAVIGKLARELNDASTGEGLTPTQYSVLALVRARGPLGLADLAELEGLNPTMVSRVIRVLDDAGLIQRLPDPSDLRAARVKVTPDGEQVHELIRDARTRVLTDCLERLPPETAETLLGAVPALEDLASTIRKLHGIQLGEHVVGEDQVGGGHVGAQVLDRGRAGDQQDVRGPLQEPGKGDLHWRRSERSGDF